MITTRSTIDGKRIAIRFPYDAGLVAAIRELPGAKWDHACRVWTVDKRHRAQIDAFVADGNRELARREARQKAEKETERLAARAAAERRDREARERHAALRDDERVAKAKADAAAGRGRIRTIAHSAPVVGTVMRVDSSIVRITGHGKVFRLDDDNTSIGRSVGCEGERACYSYYERATPTETAAFETREAEEKAAAEMALAVSKARSAAISLIETSNDRTHLGREPEGETIWSDDRFRAGGLRRWVVLTPDGWLWHCDYRGGDGDTWGDFNLGRNTTGSRIHATDELVAAIRRDAS